MGRLELGIRIAFGICASLYFCFPFVTFSVAAAFGAGAVVLLLTLMFRPAPAAAARPDRGI